MVQNTGNTEDAYTATIVGTTGPITASLVGLDGSPTQSITIFRLPGLSTGEILVQADLAGAGPGTVTVLVTSLNHGDITSMETATVSATIPGPTPGPLPVDGPKVTLLQRYGIHMMPTTLALHFDQPLDPASAQDLKAYRLTGPQGQPVAILTAVYDATAETVTLYPSRRINFHRPFRLTVRGMGADGLRNAQGQLLDGRASGHPGSNYVTTVDWRNLVWPDPARPGRSSRFIERRSEQSDSPGYFSTRLAGSRLPSDSSRRAMRAWSSPSAFRSPKGIVSERERSPSRPAWR
jgi:hypothetical protein